MFRKISFVSLLLLLLLLAPISTRAATGRALQVDTVARGVRLSLIVPGSVFSRGELTWVNVRVQNVSGQSLRILPGFTDRNCAVDNPQVQSLTPDGTVRYPPAVRSINPGPIPPCVGGGATGFGSSAPLGPGAARQGRALVILGASRLRAVVGVVPLKAGNRVAGRPSAVVGQTLQVRLTQALKPRIVPCSTAYTCLRVLPPPGAHASGPLYYAYSARCRDTNGNLAYSQDVRLTATGSATLHLGCGAPLAELHLVAGWLDQPIVRLDRVFAPGAGSREEVSRVRAPAAAPGSRVTDR